MPEMHIFQLNIATYSVDFDTSRFDCKILEKLLGIHYTFNGKGLQQIKVYSV